MSSSSGSRSSSASYQSLETRAQPIPLRRDHSYRSCKPTLNQPRGRNKTRADLSSSSSASPSPPLPSLPAHCSYDDVNNPWIPKTLAFIWKIASDYPHVRIIGTWCVSLSPSGGISTLSPPSAALLSFGADTSPLTYFVSWSYFSASECSYSSGLTEVQSSRTLWAGRFVLSFSNRVVSSSTVSRFPSHLSTSKLPSDSSYPSRISPRLEPTK